VLVASHDSSHAANSVQFAQFPLYFQWNKGGVTPCYRDHAVNATDSPLGLDGVNHVFRLPVATDQAISVDTTDRKNIISYDHPPNMRPLSSFGL
jgi:hypothetical protein